MTSTTRLSTGVEGLDERLGGGLLPGTLTVVVGSTGIGKRNSVFNSPERANFRKGPAASSSI